MTSRQGNSEVYAICLNYKGSINLENCIPVFKSVYGNENYGTKSLFTQNNVPESFLTQIQECALYFCSIQCQVINDNLQAYLMQNNIALHRNIKKIRAIVAAKFVCHYNLKPLSYDQEILKGILHEENKVNMNPRYHRGSYTERQLYAKMSLREKLSTLNSFLHAEVLSNPMILIDEPVKWVVFYDEAAEMNLIFTYGRPLVKINSSKFIFVPIFKLCQQIMAEEEFKDIAFCRYTVKEAVDFTKFGIQVNNVLHLPEIDCFEGYSCYEKKHFRMLLNTLKGMSIGETLFLQNINALSHFNVSVLYVISKKCFEKIGFTSSNSIVLGNMMDKSALSYLEAIETECDNVAKDENRDVLSSLAVQTTNTGEFFTNIVFYNNTFYRNKCVEYLMKIEKFI